MGMVRFASRQRQELPPCLRPAANKHLVHDDLGQQASEPRQIRRLTRDRNAVPVIFEKLAEEVKDLLVLVDQENMRGVIVSVYDQTFRVGASCHVELSGASPSRRFPLRSMIDGRSPACGEELHRCDAVLSVASASVSI